VSRNIKDLRIVGKFPIKHLNGFDSRLGLFAVDRATHGGHARLESKFFAAGRWVFFKSCRASLHLPRSASDKLCLMAPVESAAGVLCGA